MEKMEIDIFDPESIDRAIARLDSLTEAEPYYPEFEKLAEQFADIVREEIIATGAVGWTGELLDSVVGYFDPASMTIVVEVGADYAWYVEFGTGIPGQRTAHPKAKEQGWRYNVRGREPGETWQFMASDGNFYYTEGQRSKRFMLRAEERIRQILEGLSND